MIEFCVFVIFKVLLKFGQAKFTETCFEGGRLDILVVEDEGYAKKYANGGEPGNVYGFKFVLKPKCSDQPMILCKFMFLYHI